MTAASTSEASLSGAVAQTLPVPGSSFVLEKDDGRKPKRYL